VRAAVLPSLLSLFFLCWPDPIGSFCYFFFSFFQLPKSSVFGLHFKFFALNEVSFIEWIAQKVNFVQPPHLSYYYILLQFFPFSILQKIFFF
jgi:hypothetical protein